MKRASTVRLVQLKAEKHVAKHRDNILVSGDFVVNKNETEKRVITDAITNPLIDEETLLRPSFAHIRRLRAYWVPRSCRRLINKNDARHYFYAPAIGRRQK